MVCSSVTRCCCLVRCATRHLPAKSARKKNYTVQFWVPMHTIDYWCLRAKSPLFADQIHNSIPNRSKYLKRLVLYRKYGWLMENHRQETHNDIMCASTGNTTNTPQFIQPICPIWYIFEKSSHHLSIVHSAVLHLL